MFRSPSCLLLVLCTAALFAQRAPAQAVGTVDGEAVERREFEAWLLSERGELLSRPFGEWVALRRRAAELGVAVPEGRAEDLVQAEFDLRIENAFGGDREAWRRELEQQAVTVEGHRLRRELETRADLLAKAVADVGRVVPEEKVVRDWELRYGPSGVRARVRALQVAIELETPAGGSLNVEVVSVEGTAARIEPHDAGLFIEASEASTEVVVASNSLAVGEMKR